PIWITRRLEAGGSRSRRSGAGIRPARESGRGGADVSQRRRENARVALPRRAPRAAPVGHCAGGLLRAGRPPALQEQLRAPGRGHDVALAGDDATPPAQRLPHPVAVRRGCGLAHKLRGAGALVQPGGTGYGCCRGQRRRSWLAARYAVPPAASADELPGQLPEGGGETTGYERQADAAGPQLADLRWATALLWQRHLRAYLPDSRQI